MHIARIFFAAIILFTWNISNAQTRNWLWAKSESGSGSTTGTSVATDNNGNIYATGNFSGTTKFDSVTLTSAGDQDFFVAKYNAFGKLIWIKSFGGPKKELSNAITLDPSGAVYITGSFQSNALSLGLANLSNDGYADIFTAKYDPANGNVLWARSAGGSYDDVALDIVANANAEVYITGYFESPSPRFGTFTLPKSGSYDMFLAKYVFAGNVVWAQSRGGENNDRGLGITFDKVGNIYVTGDFSSTSLSIDNYTFTNAGLNDIFIIKFNPSGNVLWATAAGGQYYDVGSDVCVDSKNNVYVFGTFQSPKISFDTTVIQNPGSMSVNSFLVKYDGNGKMQWVKNIGGLESEVAYSMATDARDIIYVTGTFTSSSLQIDSLTLKNAGVGYQPDIFLIGYNPAGKMLWATSIGGSGTDVVKSLAVTDNGNLIVTGNYSSTSINFGTATLTSPSGNSGYGFIAALYEGVTGSISPRASNFNVHLFPNPFAGFFNIQYTLPAAAHVQLRIYNMEGKEVYYLPQERQAAGDHSQKVGINGAAGLYYYRLTIDGQETSGKVIAVTEK